MDKLKQSLHFPNEMLIEIREQAVRLDRSMSWVVQQASKIARKRLRALPSDPQSEKLRARALDG